MKPKKKFDRLLISLFLAYILITFIIGFSYPLLLDEGLYAQFSKMLASGQISELVSLMGNGMGHPPLNIAINAFFISIFGFSEFTIRILTMLCAIALFPASFLLARQFNLDRKKSAWFAFLIVLAFPVLYLSHFAMTDVPALLFSELSILFFMKYKTNKNNILLGALFCTIGFFFKQYEIATAILIPYIFVKEKFRLNKYIIGAIAIFVLPIISWSLFNSLLYGGGRVFSSYITTAFDPWMMLRKLGWLVYIMGFYVAPFIPFMLKEKLSKKWFYALLLVPLAFISTEFLGSTVSHIGYSVNGRIPLLYHVLPWSIYLVIAGIFFICFIFFISKLKIAKGSDETALILVIASFLFLISIKISTLSGLISMVDIRHTIFLLPLLWILAFKYVKINKLFVLISALLIAYSLLWTLALIATANSGYATSVYINENISEPYYAEPPLLYVNTPGTFNMTEAKYIVSGEGFASSSLLNNCSIVKTFNTSLFGKTIAKRYICRIE